MTKLAVYETNSGPFAAVNDFDATAKAQFLATATTAENIAVTSGDTLVCLTATDDCWYEADATAAIPSADETSSSSVYLPAGIRRFVTCRGVSNISVVSNSASAIVSALFWTD